MEHGGSTSAREASTNSRVKIMHNDKLDKDFVKLKLLRDPTSAQSDLYELKISLFDNGGPQAFFCSFVTSTWLLWRQ